MKVVTLKNIPPDLKRVIEERARQTGSMNKAVISLLEEAAGIHRSPNPAQRKRDFSQFAGCWTQKEAKAFDRKLRLMRTIEPELWNV